MSELTRENHRNRTRETYLQAGADAFKDHNLLELLLFYAIPRKDVKPIAYELINAFGSLEKVFEADIEDLAEVRGVGINTAILIKLISDINSRCYKNKNNGKSKNAAKSLVEMKAFVKNHFVNVKNEKLLVITLSSSKEIINTYFVAEGSVNFANADPKRIVKTVLSDNAPNVIIAHNHPQSSYEPSKEDVEFTKNLNALLGAMNINLLDHIIVGENGVFSLANDIRFVMCFQ